MSEAGLIYLLIKSRAAVGYIFMQGRILEGVAVISLRA